MNDDPFLILQMQRIGDIILSFPLMLWLKRQLPSRQIYVVAEPIFYKELLDVSPPVTYLPWTATREIRAKKWGGIVNLSHRPEAAALAGAFHTRHFFGPHFEGKNLRIRGDWQLYLASLTDNNRHNRFHWVELFSLDSIDKSQWGRTRFPFPRDLDAGAVGFFVGASQKNKRPDAAFWAALARECEQRGLKPVLFGGPEDKKLGSEIVALHGGKLLNLCGRTTLSEFAALGQSMSLLVTPDTGPMHLASWTGLKVLNLSMGPVNPWETGPYNPGHYILRSGVSCQGCWQCRFDTSHCKCKFNPSQVAYLVRRIVYGERIPTMPGMRLYCTGRTREGFYNLTTLYSSTAGRTAQELIGELWRNAFVHFFGLGNKDSLDSTCKELSKKFPHICQTLHKNIERLERDVSSLSEMQFNKDHWRRFSPVARPLTGYIQMRLGNEDYSSSVLESSLAYCDTLRSLLD